MSGKKFLMGAVVGGAIAAVAALLLAPKKGKQMRKELGRKYDDACCKTKEIVEEMSDQAKDLAEKATSLACDAKEAVETLIKEIKK